MSEVPLYTHGPYLALPREPFGTAYTAAMYAPSPAGKVDKANWKREFKLPWREAGPPNYLSDRVDSD